AIVAACLFSSCSNVEGWFGSNDSADSAKLASEGAYKAKLVRDKSITKENSYSDLFLDSAALENYIRQQNLEGNKAQRMREFYLVRNNQFAWFTSEGLTEQARGLWSLRADDLEIAKDSSAKAITERMDSLLTSNTTIADSGMSMNP